jgi:dTDP-glucose 4,6-dehydratase
VWLHAKDTAAGVITLIKEQEEGIFNIGGNCELQNIEVVRKIIATLYGKTEPYIPSDISQYCDFTYHRDGQDLRYSLDDSKLRALGWTNKCDLDKELPTVVNYYRNKFVW